MKNIIKTILSRKIYMLLSLTFLIGWVNAQTVYTVNSTNAGQTGTDATRTGTLEWCINRIAYGNDPGTNFKVVFNVGGGTQYINISNPLSLYASKTVEVEAASQGSCAPLIYIRGANNGLNGFEAGNGCNLTIKNIGFQNLKNGIVFGGNGTLNVYGCYFGLESDGSISNNARLTENGINLSGGSTVHIGGNGTCEPNLIMNCGTNNPGNNNGINISGSPTNVQIVGNTLSANVGGGINISGTNNITITNNKIGTDVLGTKPLGNRTYGLRIEGGGGHTISGNIISANGYPDFTHNPNGCLSNLANSYDFTNIAGLYIKSASNIKIAGNYIGTDITGNQITVSSPYDMGNFYAGIKVEVNCNNIQIGGPNLADRNYVGGNGFRSNMADAIAKTQLAAGSTNCEKYYGSGHGILLKSLPNNNTNTTVQNNFIGVGKNNVAKVGNRLSGVEIQGSSNVRVLNNVIGDNAWGIFNQVGSLNSNQFLGNKIGTDSTGTVAIGNGIRPTVDVDNDGGGIQIKDNSNNIVVGSVESPNIISGNYLGILITGSGSDVAKNTSVIGNLIGTSIDGNTKLGAQLNGIIISGGANGSTVTSNVVGGSIQDAIVLSNGDNNKFSLNKISVGLDGTTAIANGGNGFLINTGSTGNTIGSATAGAGNIITNQPKNAIEITDGASINNAIRNNSIYCNTLRGIELNALGNNSYAKPTFTGSETAITVTGVAGDWIEIYALDGCNDCETNPTNNKLQGKTLLKAGASPLAFTGTPDVKYTATATKGGTATVAGTNSSEFTNCYTLCLPPNVTDPVVTAISPICLGTDGTVTVSKTEAGVTYQATIAGVAVGLPKVSTGADVILTIPTASLNSATTYTIIVTARTLPICTAVPLTDDATIVVNKKPEPKTATGSTVCSVTTGGNPANATVTINNPETGVTYVAFTSGTELAGQSYSAGVITIPVGSLAVGDNALVIFGQVGGCPNENVSTATVTVNPDPKKDPLVTGSEICGSGTDSATVTIQSPEAKVVYVAYKGTTELSGQKYKSGVISIPVGSLTNPGDNEIIVHARIPGCVDVILTNKANIKVNKLPVPTSATGSVICSTDLQGTITVSSPEAGVTYVAYKGAAPLADQTYAGGVITVKRTSLVEGDNNITVHAEIPGCVSVPFLSTVNIKVNHNPDQKTISATGPICENTNTTVTLVNPQTGVTYTVIDSLGAVVKTLSPVLSATGTGTYTLSGVGFHFLKVKAAIEGCTTVNLTDTAGVQVNDGVDKVEVSGLVDTLCANANSLTITIINPEASVVYDVYEGLTKLNTSPINVANPTFKIENISVGSHNYQIKGTVGGCDAATVKEFSVVVNDLPNTSGITLSANDYAVCENNPITISVEPTKSASYTYTLLYGNGAPVAVPVIRGNNGKASFIPYAFNVGIHDLKVVESVRGCASDTIKNVITIEIDSTINVGLPQLSANSNVQCEGGTISLTLIRAQKGVSYTLKENGLVKETKTAATSNETILFGPYTAVYPPADHVFSLTASNKGCDSVSITSTATVTVNPKPDASTLVLSSNDSILCAGQLITFQVKPTKKAIFKYHLLNNGAALGDTLPGNEGTLVFGSFTLEEGTHEIKVVESVQACASSTSGPLTIVVDPAVADTAVITANKDTTCSDTQFGVTISKTQKGVSYTLFQSRNGGAGIVVGTKKAVNNGDELKFEPLGPLGPGTYTYYAKGSSNGCDSVTLTSKDAVVVNEKPTQAITVTPRTPICIDQTTTLTIEDGALTGVTYSVYRKLVSKDTLLGSTKTNEFVTAPYPTAGKDNMYVIASVKGCTDVRLSDEAEVVINEFPNRNLLSEGATVCHNDPANVLVKLFGTDSRWNYSVKLADTTFAPQNALTGDLSFELYKRKIAKGINPLVFSVFVPGCGSDTVAVDTVYSIGEIDGLEGDQRVCVGETITYTAPRIFGITGYNFTVPAKATKVSSDAYTVTVLWPDTSSTGWIKASPIGTIGACDEIYDSLYVRVYPPRIGDFDFINNDTICVKSEIWVGLTGAQGISFDSLYAVEAPDGVITYVDTLASDFDFDRYLLRFNEIGKYILKYKTISECTNEIDTVRQTIVVLPYPVANAGEYPVIDMKYYPREVVLDGSNSTHSTAEYPMVYKWSIVPKSNVNNSNSMIASFVPEQTSQTLVLEVANAHKNMCPVRDTALIVIDLGIFIPNVFTPNSDGDHDYWDILNVNAFYPDVNVEVYSKWGTLVYSSKGYPAPWDGTRNGEEVPSATYYYVIDLKKPGFKPLAGSVTIIR